MCGCVGCVCVGMGCGGVCGGVWGCVNCLVPVAIGRHAGYRCPSAIQPPVHHHHQVHIFNSCLMIRFIACICRFLVVQQIQARAEMRELY